MITLSREDKKRGSSIPYDANAIYVMRCYATLTGEMTRWRPSAPRPTAGSGGLSMLRFSKGLDVDGQPHPCYSSLHREGGCAPGTVCVPIETNNVD